MFYFVGQLSVGISQNVNLKWQFKGYSKLCGCSGLRKKICMRAAFTETLEDYDHCKTKKKIVSENNAILKHFCLGRRARAL